MRARDERSIRGGPDRRSFLKTLTAGAAAGLAAPGAIEALASGALPLQGGASAVPLGMLGSRLERSGKRLTGAGTPAYTPSFVLADVALSPSRRFNEFSGDLSGRYLGALSIAPVAGAGELAALVRDLLGHQRADGRFGAESLAFTAGTIGPPHMALLWGNGRLLVGLLENWRTSRDQAVLAASRRLADFLVAVRQQCSDPAVARRVEGQGAVGFICFTQLIEGLVLTAEATGDRRYLQTATEIAPLLPPRGIQHSHGYLSTLRGVMLLHRATRDPQWLQYVQSRYDDLVTSPDYTIYGSVLEYFGWSTPGVTDAERARLLAASGQHPRDEGCSSADFVRLSLQLWQATGRAEYLDRAERALENGLYPNQWETGDFGSRVTFERGLMPSPSTARCWWCCTMHGHRALADVLASAVVRRDEGLYLTWLGEAQWQDGSRSVRIVRSTERDGTVGWQVEASGLARGDALLLREPAWASRTTADFGSVETRGPAVDGVRAIPAPAGGRLVGTVRMMPRARVEWRDRTSKDASGLGEAAKTGALFYGPWLMAADEQREPLFFGEPWEENVVSLAAAPRVEVVGDAAPDAPGLALQASYAHGGFPGTQSVSLTPLAAQSDGPQRTLAVWLEYRKG